MSRLTNRRRLAELGREYDDRRFYYAKAAGMFLPDALEDWFFSESEEAFFAEYERDMAAV